VYDGRHDVDVYFMWNPVTEQVHVTRDIIWLHHLVETDDVSEECAQRQGTDAALS